jgi:hypothetical protein
MFNKELILFISLISALIIGVIIYDYQSRKIFKETIKRIATMGTLKKVVKSPITAFAFIWAFLFGSDKD